MTRSALVATLSWIQLMVSGIFAILLAWGYVNYQSTLGQFSKSLAQSVLAVSDVVRLTAHSIQSRNELLESIEGEIQAVRASTLELKRILDKQVELAPRYSDGARAAADTMDRFGRIADHIGHGLIFRVPTDIEWRGTRTSLKWSVPLESQANEIIAQGKDLQALAATAITIADTISKDGQRMRESLASIASQTEKVLDEMDKALASVRSNDLPRAIAKLNQTSDHLIVVSDQINFAGGLSEFLLSLGIILAVLGMINSLTNLLLANAPTIIAGKR